LSKNVAHNNQNRSQKESSDHLVGGRIIFPFA
jgi:hypothetical protein